MQKFYKSGTYMNIEVVDNGFIVNTHGNRDCPALVGSSERNEGRKVIGDLNTLLGEVVSTLTYQIELSREKQLQDMLAERDSAKQAQTTE